MTEPAPIIVERLPVVGGPANGETAEADTVRIDVAGSVYVRRSFIVPDPVDPEMAHLIGAFVPEDDIAGAAGLIRALVHVLAILAGHTR